MMGKELEERLEAALVAGDRADNRVMDRDVHVDTADRKESI
jgi:hypothetical protein